MCCAACKVRRRHLSILRFIEGFRRWRVAGRAGRQGDQHHVRARPGRNWNCGVIVPVAWNEKEPAGAEDAAARERHVWFLARRHVHGRPQGSLQDIVGDDTRDQEGHQHLGYGWA